MISWMQTHRKYLIVTIWISTIAFVGAGFVGWGAYSFSENKAGNVAKVGERSISAEELQSSYNNVYNYYNQVLDGKLTQEKAQELKLQDIALNQLIRETLLLNYADELGLTALQSEVVSQIHDIDNFKENGNFSKETYFKTLKAINKKVKDFEESIKKEVTINKLTNALSMPNTNLELETLAASIYLQDKIKVKMVNVKDSDILINDKELKEFWDTSRANYLSDKSYSVEIIKIPAEGIAIDESAKEEFYNDNKHLFKGSDDKIIKFEDAKKLVKAKMQLKIAKKEILKKYLAFKDGKIPADETKILTEKNSDIPLEKIISVKVGSFIKAIELPDGYVTAKLTAVNMPEPLKYEDAKEEARVALFKSKKAKLLETKSIEQANEAKGMNDLGFISREDVAKFTMLSENEARVFLDRLFERPEKKGYYIYDDKAIIYEITEQKLENQEQLETNKEELIKTINSIKNNTMQTMLLKELENRYKIEKY